MRYERKYRIESSSYDRVLHEVLSNLASFVTAYPDRKVNSIYYDDINFTAYNDNLLGISERIKYRIRWYGENLEHISKPILEKKIKKNLLGTKELTKFGNFSLKNGAPTISPFTTNQLSPHVIVSYIRSYFISTDGLLRATIDRQLEYTDLINGLPSLLSQKDNSIILELKYDQGQEDIAKLCTNALPYRMTKNSKYVSAMKCYLQ